MRIWSKRLTWPEIMDHRLVEVGRPAFQTPEYADLQASWDMNQSMPGQVFDRASGFGRADNFATFVNGAAPDDRVPPLSPNVAAFLVASPDYAVLPTGDGYGNGLTIEAWIAPFQFLGTQTIAGRDRDTGFWLGLTSTGHVRFQPTGGAVFLESSAPVPEFGWSHVAATYRDGLTTIYRNGRVDAQTTAITGPVGENGRDVFVGADNHVPGPDLAYVGWLDEVRVLKGHKTPEQVLQEMFVGYTGFTNPDAAPSEDGPAPRWRADFDGISDVEVIGSGAVLQKSGAPIGNPTWITTSGTVYAFENEIPGGIGALPNGDLVVIRVIEIDVPFSGTIHDLDIFVSMPSADLTLTDLVLISPDNTQIGLLYGGDAHGRDLHTILDDDAIATYATGIPPHTGGVRPTDPLSSLDGEDSQGTWQLVAQGPPLDVWAVGLLINGRLATGVTSVASTSPTGLRLAGPNPARQATRFAFELARPSRISVDLYDVAGRHRRTLARDSRSAGAHEVAWQRHGLPAGVYVVALRVDDRLAGSQRFVVRD